MRARDFLVENTDSIVAVIDGVRSDRQYNDVDHAHNSLGKLVAYGRAKVAELYVNGEKYEHFEIGKKYRDFEPKSLGLAEGSLNEFAPDAFNSGDEGEEFNPRLAKMAYDEGVVKGVSLSDNATLKVAIAINDWDKHDGGIYKQHFAKGFKAGRMNKINHDNKRYNLNLILNKDGSISHGEQGMAEAFNQPYATDLEKSEHDDYDSLVQLPDGSHLSVMFNNQGDGEYQVEFWRGPSQGVTGEGDAQRIFATVLSTIQRFIKEHNPWRLTFSATKNVEPGQNSESRAKLYNRLVDRYAAAWGYDAYNEDHGDQVEYELTRLKPSVAEGFPNFNREWDEATRYPEFVNLGKEKWIELVSKGKQVTVTRKNVNKINNTDAADPKSFKLLDPEKQKRALAQLANGDVEMPIVARYSDGYLELIGGNTRLTAQMAKDGQAKVWLFNVPEELTQGVAEATGDEKFDTMMGRIAAEPKVPDIHPNMPPTSIPELLQWAKENNKPYHYKFAEWAKKHNFTNVNAALMWFGDNVDPWDEFGPKDHLNVFGDLVGEPLIDAAKHNPKAAELLKVFACYEKIYDDWTDQYRQMNTPDRFKNPGGEGVAETR